LMQYKLQGIGSQVEALIHNIPITYHIGTVGYHWAVTSVAALAAATAVGADLASAAAALADFREPEGRGKIQLVGFSENHTITIIDDCYNASPIAMVAAIAKLDELHESLGSKGRKIAVLGDMLELGIASADLHKDLLTSLQKHKIDKIYTV